MPSIHVVPVIYDHTTKRVLRWFLLDFERQLKDPAFLPANHSERVLYIPIQVYRTFGTTAHGYPALIDLQNYVNGAAP